MLFLFPKRIVVKIFVSSYYIIFFSYFQFYQLSLILFYIIHKVNQIESLLFIINNRVYKRIVEIFV